MDVTTAALLAQRHISRNLVLDRFQSVFSEFDSIFHEIEGEDSDLQIIYDSIHPSSESESDINSRPSELPLRLPFLVRPRFVKRIPAREVEEFSGIGESDIIPPVAAPLDEEDSSVPVAFSSRPHPSAAAVLPSTSQPQPRSPPAPSVPIPTSEPVALALADSDSTALPSTPPRRLPTGLSAPTTVAEATLSPIDLESRQAQAIAVRHSSPEKGKEGKPPRFQAPPPNSNSDSLSTSLPPKPKPKPNPNVVRCLVFDDEKEKQCEEEEGEDEVDEDEEDDDDDDELEGIIRFECVFVVDEDLLDIGEDAEMFSLSDPEYLEKEDDDTEDADISFSRKEE